MAKRRATMWVRRGLRTSYLFSFVIMLPGLGVEAGSFAPLIAAILFWPLVWVCGLIHEVGHAVCALLAGGRVIFLAVRPMMVRFAPLRCEWIGRRKYRSWLPGGRTEYRFSRRHGKHWGLVSAGGAMFDLVFALVAISACLAGIMAPAATSILAALSALCVADAVATLVPYRGSDGAEFVKLRRVAARSV